MKRQARLRRNNNPKGRPSFASRPLGKALKGGGDEREFYSGK
jgi:hypothetical protein